MNIWVKYIGYPIEKDLDLSNAQPSIRSVTENNFENMRKICLLIILQPHPQKIIHNRKF